MNAHKISGCSFKHTLRPTLGNWRSKMNHKKLLRVFVPVRALFIIQVPLSTTLWKTFHNRKQRLTKDKIGYIVFFKICLFKRNTTVNEVIQTIQGRVFSVKNEIIFCFLNKYVISLMAFGYICLLRERVGK